MPFVVQPPPFYFASKMDFTMGMAKGPEDNTLPESPRGVGKSAPLPWGSFGAEITCAKQESVGEICERCFERFLSEENSEVKVNQKVCEKLSAGAAAQSERDAYNSCPTYAH